MKEICGLETKIGKESGLEQANAQKSEEHQQLLPLSALNQGNSLADSIQALFDFIETELVVPDSKQSTLVAL